MKLSKVLRLYTKKDVDELLETIGSRSLSDPTITDQDMQDMWKFVGDNEQNASTIDLLENGEKGIVERLTNGIDAVLERKLEEKNVSCAKKSEDIIKVAFPKYQSHLKNIMEGEKTGHRAYDAKNQIILAANDGTRKSTPTFDIIDVGTGLNGNDFSRTILSLHGRNKIKKNTNYLIGAFGQGGSTSLAFAYATIIISKFDSRYFFTIVMKTHIVDYKNHTYVYLVKNDKIIELENDVESSGESDYLTTLLNDTSGTLVRMVDLEVSQRYRESDIAKPRMLGDYFNIELYGTPLPILMVENRVHFKEKTVHHQKRYVYGTRYKLKTWKKNVKDQYSGFIEIVHNDRTYKIEFYIILPKDEADWINDNKCRETYDMFNVHGKPIFYTVNGQYINGEHFTKLQNRGLSYLKYRLLVHIDLDLLGDEKYSFFTTDRSRIKGSDLTSGFVDKVVKELSENQQLNEINNKIAKMSIEKGLDEETLEKLKNEVKEDYADFLNPTKPQGGYLPKPNPKPRPNDEVYNDYIKDIIITNKKSSYYMDEQIRIILKTEAYKYVNEAANIKAYLSGKEKYIENKAIMQGRIQYVIDDLKPGKHKLTFIYFYDNNMMQSNAYEFTVLNEKADIDPKGKKFDLDMQIDKIKESESIVSIEKNMEKKRIRIKLCLEHKDLNKYYIGKTESDVSVFKNRISKPICLMALFAGEFYDNLDPEKQNKMIQSLVATLHSEYQKGGYAYAK